jgi:hypothetical protein
LNAAEAEARRDAPSVSASIAARSAAFNNPNNNANNNNNNNNNNNSGRSAAGPARGGKQQQQRGIGGYHAVKLALSDEAQRAVDTFSAGLLVMRIASDTIELDGAAAPAADAGAFAKRLVDDEPRFYVFKPNGNVARCGGVCRWLSAALIGGDRRRRSGVCDGSAT